MKRSIFAVPLLLVFAGGLTFAREYKVEIANLKYNPARLSIKKGDKVIWTNSDDRDHTVKSNDDGKTFDSGKIAAGETFKHTFSDTGKFEFGCAYHPRMKGVIVVSD